MRSVILILCALVFFVPTFASKRPEPVAPAVPQDLVNEITAALADGNNGTATQHAGWALAVRDTLVNGDEPINRLRTVWIKARKTMGLQSVLGPAGKALFEPFAEGDIDRDEYAKAWATLAAACNASGK